MNELTKPKHQPFTEKLVEDHYKNLSNSYDDYLLYSPQFVRLMTKKMIQMLDLKNNDVFVDLGGGTGMYTKDILEQVDLKTPAILVDPFAEMLGQADSHPQIECKQHDGLAFSELKGDYDKVLMKEAVHHVQDKSRLFGNLFERLLPGGKLLLVHVPPELDYPIFEKALERARNWHADPEDLRRSLFETGFQVEHEFIKYPHSISKEKYISMVRTGYMTVLSSFKDEEIEEGIREMETNLAGKSTLEFEDHFDFILACKPA
ncbi:MAG: methyltransferase domain-containing protein [Candidatus Nitronauta litoralis]|uniref:Methyltransferase domain-containing protein n=1 Tax=Candidatus Nitronauta litoralis TaxID=2705533 RepID=A0A7T0BU15_9BACT|nr:MAG: methyltransferase domain-containing protein [Candidatus Nitronauta litoralis]